MRAAFAHDAVLDMEPTGDLAAPGGAVALELCGSSTHPPPCPLAPHHTRAERRGDVVVVRVLFAVEAADEAAVRTRIVGALAAGSCARPDGTRVRWTVRSSTPGVVTDAERAHAARLVRG